MGKMGIVYIKDRRRRLRLHKYTYICTYIFLIIINSRVYIAMNVYPPLCLSIRPFETKDFGDLLLHADLVYHILERNPLPISASKNS